MSTKNTETSAKRAATVQKNRQARIDERGYALPLVLTCKVTGSQVKYTSPAYVDKVVQKYGSLENLKTNFVSRAGRRQQAEAAKAAKAAA